MVITNNKPQTINSSVMSGYCPKDSRVRRLAQRKFATGLNFAKSIVSIVRVNGDYISGGGIELNNCTLIAVLI